MCEEGGSKPPELHVEFSTFASYLAEDFVPDLLSAEDADTDDGGDELGQRHRLNAAKVSHVLHNGWNRQFLVHVSTAVRECSQVFQDHPHHNK